MTTEEMKLALLWYFRCHLRYPLMVTEGRINYWLADILAIRKTIVVEVEIKKNFCEIKQDLKIKWSKHLSYLNGANSDRIPNKFYFALPSGFKEATLQKYKDIIPKPYGLIVVDDDQFKLHGCHTVKRGQYLTRRTDHLEKLKERMSWRLTAENINLRLKLMERK